MLMDKDKKLVSDWYQDWLSAQTAADYICTHPDKNPDLDKIEEYCRRAQGGRGCPNLFLRPMVESRPGVWGKWGYVSGEDEEESDC